MVSFGVSKHRRMRAGQKFHIFQPMTAQLDNFNCQTVLLLVESYLEGWKDQIILPLVWGILADFWVPHEIDSWIFQNLLDLGFHETSKNFSSFRHLLFSFLQRGAPWKKIQKTYQEYTLDLVFSKGSPFEVMKVKVV